MSRRRRLWVTALASLAAAAAFSFLKLGYHCREPASEACVWGKAYFPVTLPLETLLFGAIVFGIIIGVRHMMIPR